MRYMVFFLLLLACEPIMDEQVPVQVPPPPPPEPIFEDVPLQAPVSAQVQRLCVDSDEGMDEFTKGTVTNGTDVVSDACLSLQARGQTIPLNKVVEYFCENSQVVAEAISCAHGCVEGACRKEPLPEPEVVLLVEEGDCKQGASVGPLKVTACYNACLQATACQKKEVKTRSVTLPWQLSCLVRSDTWLEERWLEFELQKEAEVFFKTEVLGSELVSVTVHDERGARVASLINQQVLGVNRCFGYGVGSAKVTLPPGRYEVHVGARAQAPHLLRSFFGKSFGVAVSAKV